MLDYKQGNDRKTFHSSTKLIANDSDIDKAFKSMHQSIMMEMKNSASEDWIKRFLIVSISMENWR